MKKLCIFFALLFCSISYSQSDEIKLVSKSESLYGKVIIIKSSMVEFRDSTGLLFEFKPEEINFIRPAKGDTLWFNKHSSEKTESDFDSRDINNLEYNNKKITLFLSYNFAGTHESNLSYPGSLNVYAGISFGAEYDFIIVAQDRIKFGVGAMYQFPRKLENVKGSFNFIPIYAFVKLGMLNREKIKIYAIPTIGYNIFSGDKNYFGNISLSGRVFNSFGLGLLIKNNLDVKFLYQFNRGSGKLDSVDYKINYTNFNLNFGYYF